MAPCFEMDWISELSRVNCDIPAITDFCDNELMLQRLNVNDPMIVLSENAPRSILLMDTSLNVMLFMNRPEKALALTASILLFSIVIDLNDDGNTFGDNAGEDMLTNLRLIVGSSVGTFNLNALCSKTSSLMFIALKLRIPAKAFCFMTVLAELMMLMLTVCALSMEVSSECWCSVRLWLFSMLSSCSFDTEMAPV